MDMKGKRIILFFLPLSLLASCSGNKTGTGEKQNSGNSIPDSQSPTTVIPPKTAEEHFEDFLVQRKKGYSFKGKNFYYTDEGYSNYCLDVFVKDDGYEFVRYESKQNAEADRSTVYISYYYTYDPSAETPYVSEPILGIDNRVDYSPAPIGEDEATVKWKDSSYINLFSSLTIDDFLFSGDNAFVLDTSSVKNSNLLPKLAEQFYPKNPGRTIKEFSFIFDEETDSFTFSLLFNPYGGFSQTERNITGDVIPGDGFSFDKEVNVSTDAEKPELEAALEKLRTNQYSFVDTISAPNADQSALEVESMVSGKTDGKSLLLSSSSQGISNEFLYQYKDGGYIQQAVRLNNEYYAYHDKVKASVTALLPSFKRSSVFFEKDENQLNTYVYNKKAMFSTTKIYNRSGEGRIVGERKIKLSSSNVTFNINFTYPQKTEEIVYTFLDDEDIGSDIVVKETTDGLKTSDLVSGYSEILKNVIALLGSKENLDLIPILGGKESVAGLYYSDGVDEEGNEGKERYYAIEYRILSGTGLNQVKALESKLEKNGFALDKGNSGTHFQGDIYTKTIQVNKENKIMELEIGYSSNTVAIAINAK